MTAPGVDIGLLMDYELGVLKDPDVLKLFGELISSGMAWSLQGHYGRTATAFLEAGVLDDKGDLTDIGRDVVAQYWDENPGEDVMT